MAIRKVGVVGAGLMGSGIAQTCAQSGYETIVCEIKQEFLDKGLARIYGRETAALPNSGSNLKTRSPATQQYLFT